jgi:single-stranded-DNA-specific exonuclease
VRWRLTAAPDRDAARALASALGMPMPLAALLIQRGHSTLDAARSFLRPDLATLTEPTRLTDIDRAVDTIAKVIARGARILVHGDYDVDGQCSAAIMIRALRAARADVHGFIPHRLRDGYDFGAAGIAEAERIGAALIITTDCGITAVDGVAEANRRGFTVIVTDHHLPGAELPRAAAVVDPQRLDDRSGLGTLSGTGVAFKLVQALTPRLGLPENLPWHLLDYVALATVADVVPLVGENRVLVRHGLRLLHRSRWPGLRALMTSARLGAEPPRAGQVGFVVAPRLNAVGRLGDARDGLRLLLTDDPAEAEVLAVQFDALNTERQMLDQQILADALATVEREYQDPEHHRALVLSGDWHPGVIGIVASRIVERYGRPTFLIGVTDGVAKGSGRSIDRFDLHAALGECADLLERYGGHRMAAGFTIRPDRIDAFRVRFNQVAAARLAVDEVGPEQRVDLEVPGDSLDEDLERWGRHLEPCGMGNPAPVFGLRGAELTAPRTVGRNHLKARITVGHRALDLIAFDWADRWARFAAGPVDLAVRLERNEWQGQSRLQVRALAIAPG